MIVSDTFVSQILVTIIACRTNLSYCDELSYSEPLSFILVERIDSQTVKNSGFSNLDTNRNPETQTPHCKVGSEKSALI